jgi:16S rRNA (guanine966-N2)-methyltransferase
MRIVGGTHRSRRIDAPRNLPLRPTTDFAKESLFNILVNHFDLEGLSVLDLFSGTGAISFEFASRGAKKIVSIEKNPECLAFIKKKSNEFKFDNILPFKYDAFKYLEKCTDKYDIIFADPPYELPGTDRIPELVFSRDILPENGRLIIEHSSKTSFSKAEWFLEKRTYGEVNFSIFGKRKKSAIVKAAEAALDLIIETDNE